MDGDKAPEPSELLHKIGQLEELVVLLVSRVARLQARLEAFTLVSLKLQFGEDLKQHPLFNLFVKLEGDLLDSYTRSLSDQFPELRKLIQDSVAVSLDDVFEHLGEHENQKGPE